MSDLKPSAIGRQVNLTAYPRVIVMPFTDQLTQGGGPGCRGEGGGAGFARVFSSSSDNWRLYGGVAGTGSADGAIQVDGRSRAVEGVGPSAPGWGSGWERLFLTPRLRFVIRRPERCSRRSPRTANSWEAEVDLRPADAGLFIDEARKNCPRSCRRASQRSDHSSASKGTEAGTWTSSRFPGTFFIFPEAGLLFFRTLLTPSPIDVRAAGRAALVEDVVLAMSHHPRLCLRIPSPGRKSGRGIRRGLRTCICLFRIF